MTYRGRFAPSPTGPLHMGSLVAALGSWLDARAHNGSWLVRIEDLDPLRESPQAAEQILASLQAHGLIWDEPVRWQSDRHDAYERLLSQLRQSQHLYPCPCSRRQLRDHQGYHPNRCRTEPHWETESPVALRLALNTDEGYWQDALLGPQPWKLTAELDDPVLKRKEGFYAYHLAVVCDDIDQQITHVIRGQDLLDLTPIHRALYQIMATPEPVFAHLPLVRNDEGQKLSKQNQAPALNDQTPGQNLYQALWHLNQSPPDHLQDQPVGRILAWARAHWRRSALQPAPTTSG